MSAAASALPPLLGRLEWSSGVGPAGARALVWVGCGTEDEGDPLEIDALQAGALQAGALQAGALQAGALPPPAAQARALGRIAASVALQLLDPDSAELAILNDERGRPFVRGARRRAGPGPHVSIAHKRDAAAAMASWAACGIDLEPVEHRSTTFERTALAPSERALERCEDRDTWLTRLWTVKEAVAKACGHGLQGRPRDFEVRPVEGSGESFECLGMLVETELFDAAGRPHVVAWTGGCRETGSAGGRVESS